MHHPRRRQFLGTAAAASAALSPLMWPVRAHAELPDVVARIKSYNYLPVRSTPEQFARMIAQDNARWQRIVKETGYTLGK